ncbi:MAG: LPS export ABC transporter periplasmic protein LptC, partial [Fusobacteriaceae bacterium]|nr:LPS export ABC transporter periplasmic protein LptC [Fusobacteriaceae bacterium]
MKKKIIYLLILILIGAVGYWNYFSDEELPDVTNQRIETNDAVYENEDYYVTAKKQTDFLKSKDTFFSFGKVLLLKKDTTMQAEDIALDKDNNMKLRKHIIGDSKSGWHLESEQMDYLKKEELITSEEGVKAVDTVKNLSISGKYFESDSRVTYIRMRENVTIESSKLKITGDRGEYTDERKEMVLSGRIKASGADRDNNPVEGEFEKLTYNVDTKLITTEDDFSLLYRGVKLSGGRMVVNETDESFEITENVRFEGGGFLIRAEKIERAAGSDVVLIEGPIRGGNDEYSIKAEHGEYHIGEKKLYLLAPENQLEITSKKGEVLRGTRIIFDNQANFAEIMSATGVEYQSEQGVLHTKVIQYDLAAGEVILEHPFTFRGPRYESDGREARYKTREKTGFMTYGYILDKEKNQRIAGDEIRGDRERKYYAAKGNAEMENERYFLKAPEV